MTNVQESVKRSRIFTPPVVGLVGLLLTGYIVLGLLSGSNWNPTLFVKFDQVTPGMSEYATGRFDEVAYAGREGHDGKFFFIQASDPFFMEPDVHARLLDRPTYRAQRMLYPTIAGGFGLFSPTTTAWSLLILNVVGVGVGCWITALVAIELRLSPIFGLAFFINPGVLSSAVIDTAEVLAMVTLMGGILMVMRGRIGPAAAFLTFSSLSRETMLLSVVGWMIFFWVREKRLDWRMAAPFVAVGGWWLYVRFRIGYLSDGIQDVKAIGLPFDGLIEAMQEWIGERAHVDEFVIAILLLAACFFLLYLAVTRLSLLPLMSAGFSLIAILMVGEVWGHYFDASRALTPVATLVFLCIPFLAKREERGFV